MNLKSVKDRLKDETLDLSLCDLKEVPVREIVSVRKATNLDLSNNLLVFLPITFVTLKQIVKLDLSKNMLMEIPENFGEMKQLKHLDLYDNQISRLPLSLSELKNLRWLDLKENPLTPAVASVAGPCSNLKECQACARNIVAYLSQVKLTIEEEKIRRQNAITGTNKEQTTTKKEGKKKKKRSMEKDSAQYTNKAEHDISVNLPKTDEPVTEMEAKSESERMRRHRGKSKVGLCTILSQTAKWILLMLGVAILTLAVLPLYDKQESELFINYVEHVILWSKCIYDTVNDTYEKHFKGVYGKIMTNE
ncbi:hypothetical protein KM043_010483 [Ampulex compressa]|nr:hypothetical protein KM043_010483 [Ampulex compressa]